MPFLIAILVAVTVVGAGADPVGAHELDVRAEWVTTRQCLSYDGTELTGGAVNVHEGIVYDTHKGIGLKGDLYLPAATTTSATPVPAIVFVHGGGWVVGRRGAINAVFLGERAACRGYAFFDVDYLLAPRQHFPELTRDIKCAIRWLRGHAAQFGIDPKRVAVTGGSAGGHLSALVANTSDDPYFNPTCPGHAQAAVSVQAAVPFYGVYDLRDYGDLGAEGVLRQYLGDPVDADKLRRGSPIAYAETAPPTLLIHGTDDVLVPVQQSRELHAALKAAGVQSELLELDGANHAFDIGISNPYTVTATTRMFQFLDEVLAP